MAAIDACNVLLDNMSPAHAARYALSEAGLSRLTADFYRGARKAPSFMAGMDSADAAGVH
ncbi:hypothetical protein [Craterilacuibacter sp.]|uniref:hypothetical protein n=1 Tax=Craterilacuibacter sp. TaxID=2870909 RepID=UPI003F2DC6C4